MGKQGKKGKKKGSQSADSTLDKDRKTFDKGLVLYSKRKYEECIPFFKKVTHSSLIILKHYYLGLSYVQLGKFEEGLEEYRKIHEIPRNVEGVDYDKLLYGLYINMGSILQALTRKNPDEQKKQKYLNEAIACYEYALQIQDIDPRVWNNIGNAYLDLENYDKALENFNKALALDDEYPEAYYCKSLVYEFTSRFPEAIKELENALKWRNRNVSFLNRAAALCFGIQRFEEAKRYAERVLEENGENIQGLKNITLILYNMKEYEEANLYLDKLITLGYELAKEKDLDIFNVFTDLQRRSN
jgi:tetratricopeptide (TPR) repeat protein